MQETTRLVVKSFLMAFCLTVVSPAVALGQSEAPASSAPAESWGDKSKPANYVRSKGPSKDGENYKWIQMGYAGVVMLGMVGFMVWLVKRTPRKERLAK